MRASVPEILAESKVRLSLPSQKTAIRRRGDNIWRCEKGKWKVVANAYHDESQRDRDIGGEKVLVATEFFYFGRAAISIPTRFKSLLASTQGHKNTSDNKAITRFWDWIKNQAPKVGWIADPFEFTDAACAVQCSEIEVDDNEEL